ESSDRKGNQARFRTLVYLWQEIGGAEVQEEAGEEGELERDDAGLEPQQAGAKRADNRCNSVDKEQRDCSRGVIARREHEGHGVETVGEIVRDHGEEDDDPDLRAGLEADADREPVQEAVKREAERA